MQVQVNAVHNGESIIQLVIASTQELLDLQQRITGIYPEQKAFSALHITLCAAVETTKELPTPPQFVELASVAEVISRADKTSCFVRVSEQSQRELDAYVSQIEAITNQKDIGTPGRVFHVSLSNLVGCPLASIAKVWDYQTQATI